LKGTFDGDGGGPRGGRRSAGGGSGRLESWRQKGGAAGHAGEEGSEILDV
jgi:hypothetical protein